MLTTRVNSRSGRRGLTWLVLTGDGWSVREGRQELTESSEAMEQCSLLPPLLDSRENTIHSGLALLYRPAVKKNPTVMSLWWRQSFIRGSISPSVKLTISLSGKIGHYYGWLISVRIIRLICSSFKNKFIVWRGFQVLGKKTNIKNCKHNLPNFLFVLVISCQSTQSRTTWQGLMMRNYVEWIFGW